MCLNGNPVYSPDPASRLSGAARAAVRPCLHGQERPQSERCGEHHAAQVPLPWLLGGAELLGCRCAEGSCPIGACPAKVLRTQRSLRLAMVRFIEGVEHAAMGAET